jgi:hypothetical protein
VFGFDIKTGYDNGFVFFFARIFLCDLWQCIQEHNKFLTHMHTNGTRRWLETINGCLYLIFSMIIRRGRGMKLTTVKTTQPS